MTSRHAFLPAVTAAVVLVLAMVLPFAGCGLPLQGLDSPPDAGASCLNDGQCKDTNACTVGSCIAGACSYVVQPDGPAPNAKQTAFDCKVVQCVHGAPEVQNDDQDIQADAEDCTIDNCNAGQAFHTAKPNDTACAVGVDEGLCKSGKCEIACTVDAKCNDMNPCTTDTCDVAQGVCSYAPLNGINTPGAAQKDFDCHVEVCVDGVSTSSPDDSDLPKTATVCDEELCNGGVASNPPLDIDVSCGSDGKHRCNGVGVCVECNSPSQCGVNTECLKFTCVSGVCGTMPTPVNTHLAQQKPGDCHAMVCDGAGNIAGSPIVDDTDTFNDNNECTSDVCMGGVDTNPALPPGAACGNGQSCNLEVKCGCTVTAQCNSPDTCGGGNPGTAFTCGCTKVGCATLGKTCGGAVTDSCDSTQNCNDAAKNGTETDVDCGGGAAGSCGSTCGQGKQCTADTDCGTGHCADGVCCNTACNTACVACTAAKQGGGGTDGICGSIPVNQQDTSPAGICIGNTACDGNNHCRKINGQTCGMNNECANGSCADGVCCNTACLGTCLACSNAKKGSGADGVCGNIAVGQPDTAATVTCTANSACDGNGVCKKNLGQPCANGAACANGICTDGVCCGVAACPTCQSCALSANGTCVNIPVGQPDNVPANTCVGTNTCDGVGTCKKGPGASCSVTSECSAGTCVDGVCCGVMSCPMCQSCALSGNGTCANIPNGTPDTVPANACTTACNGSGTCKTANGLACPAGGAADCQNGNCVDGVCCGTAACGVCQSCSLSGNGTCSNIPNGTVDTVPAGACTTTCNGSGVCRTATGLTCPVGGAADCQSSNCVDGVCCGSAACGVCQSCSLLGNGTCSNIANNTPDPVPAGTCTTACNGSGICKAASGQACPGGVGTDCQSGFCVDGVCCGSAACGVCTSCSLSGNGTCSNIANNTPDPVPAGTCTTACDGTGTCKTATGLACPVGGAADCQSGFCSDGVCCNVACDALAICMSCNGTVPGTCSMVKSADDSDSCSTATKTCDAGGACLLKFGQPCTGDNDCASNNCSSGMMKTCL